MFLPRTWDRIDGQVKQHRRERNWVILELMYGRLLKKPLTLVVTDPVNTDLVDNFRTQILEYSEAKEIDQISPENWAAAVAPCKTELAERLSTRKWLACDLDSFTTDPFWRQFQSEVVRGAGAALLRGLLRSWEYFFEAECWSLAQAILALGAVERGKETTVRRIARFVEEHQKSEERYAWAREYEETKQLERRIRDNLAALEEFAFKFDTVTVMPLQIDRTRRRLHIGLFFEEVYRGLCTRLGVEFEDREMVECQRELSVRARD